MEQDGITLKSNGNVLIIQRKDNDDEKTLPQSKLREIINQEKIKYTQQVSSQAYINTHKPISIISDGIEYKVEKEKDDESEEEEESFEWMKKAENESNYMCLSTKKKGHFEKDKQIYYCYGRKSNRSLLL